MKLPFLSEELINAGRQRELDIAKGLAVVFMVLIHVQQYYASEEVQESILGGIIDILGGIPAAPVFMFLLGVGIVYSRRSTPQVLIKRGLLLIAAGYILNICRGTLPNLFQWAASPGSDNLYLTASSTFYIDIFQFAGLALIYFGCLRWAELRDIWILILTLGCCIANYVLAGIELTDPVQLILSGLIWGSGEISFFPFCTWIFYPVAGYFFAKVLIRCSDTSRFYTLVLLGSALVLIISWLLFTVLYQVDIGLSSEYSYYHHTIPGNIIFTAFVTGWISLLYMISRVIPELVMKICDRWSRNVSEMYVVQWILIGWFVTLIGYNNLSLPYFIEILVIILVLTDLLSRQFRLPI